MDSYDPVMQARNYVAGKPMVVSSQSLVAHMADEIERLEKLVRIYEGKCFNENERERARTSTP